MIKPYKSLIIFPIIRKFILKCMSFFIIKI
nr:MAG TPA: hypothetical protein [Caudoviricetes sp.]